MPHFKQFVLATLIIAALAGACTSSLYLKVQYHLPPSSKELTGESVAVTISDRRNDPAFLSHKAKGSLKNFDGTYSLVVLSRDGIAHSTGLHDLDSMLTEIFSQRLANEGIQTTAANASATLAIQLEAFKLDIADRKWVLRMSYQATLIKDGRPAANESVNGTAERLKLMGKSEAEEILGDLVSDMVNRLDVTKLVHQLR